MIAIDPPVRILIFSLASKGPSTHGTEGGPTIAVSASQQMKDGPAVVYFPNVAGMTVPGGISVQIHCGACR